MLVPSDADPNALTALQASITDNAIIRAAVAFVTGPGVQTLADILRATSDVSVQITARAADVTEPEALLALRDDLGVDVSVVIGHHARAFHPKLWLIERADAVIVLSGSGNLTEGGLVTNDEHAYIRTAAPLPLQLRRNDVGEATSVEQLARPAGSIACSYGKRVGPRSRGTVLSSRQPPRSPKCPVAPMPSRNSSSGALFSLPGCGVSERAFAAHAAE